MKSLAELQAIKDRMKDKVILREGTNSVRVVVGMATCGIAAGARPVLNAFVEAVAESKIENVTVAQTGCIGICQYEPVVEIYEKDKEKVTYVKMTAEKAAEVVEKHLKGGTPEDMQSVLDVINSKGIKDTAIVIDFDKDRLSALRALDDEIELWHLTNKITDETMEFVKKSNAGIGFNFGIPQNYFYINDAKREGITLASWTVDIPFVVDVLNAAGVDYITTNKIMP